MLHVPNQLIVNTGEHHLVQPTIDAFIEKAIDRIRANNSSAKLEIDFPDFKYDSDHYYNDNIVYVLANKQVICGCFVTRTPFNFVQYTFFKNGKNLKETEPLPQPSIDDYFSEIEDEIRKNYPERPHPFIRRNPRIISYGQDKGDRVDYLMRDQILIAAVIQIGPEPGRNTYIKDLALYEKTLQP